LIPDTKKNKIHRGYNILGLSLARRALSKILQKKLKMKNDRRQEPDCHPGSRDLGDFSYKIFVK